MEIWKEIVGSKGYEVSSYGRVKRLEYLRWCVPNNSYSVKKEKILALSNKNSKKYWRIRIYYNNNSDVMESVHRLVTREFILNPDNLPQVNHMDGNKDNNNVENLEWCTNEYNMAHSKRIGLRDSMYDNMQGEKSNFNKYSEETIRKIPELVNLGNSYAKVAKLLGIPVTLITEIKSGRAWKSLNMIVPDSIYCIKKI